MSPDKDDHSQEEPREIHELNVFEHATNSSDENPEHGKEAIVYDESGSEVFGSVLEIEDLETLQDHGSPELSKDRKRLVLSSSVKFIKFPKSLYESEKPKLRFDRTLIFNNKSHIFVYCACRTTATIRSKSHKKEHLWKGGGWIKPGDNYVRKGELSVRFFGSGYGTYWLEVKNEMWGLIDLSGGTWPRSFEHRPKAEKSTTWDVVPNPRED